MAGPSNTIVAPPRRRALRRGNAILLVPLLLGLGQRPAVAADPITHPLVLAAGTHSLTVPWHPGPITSRANPALSAGTEHLWRRAGIALPFLSANLGFFQHHWWMTGVFAEAGVGLRNRLPYGLRADFAIGAGYLHYFWRRQIFELSDGRYVRATDWGRPSLFVPLSIVLGYRGKTGCPLGVSPFVSARWAVQGLFLDEVPILPHLFLMVGVRVELERVMATLGR